MKNIYSPKIARVISVKQESIDTHLIRFQFAKKSDQAKFDFLPGQFMQIGLAGYGECAISICSSPHDSKKYFELAIRDLGELTRRLNELKKNDEVLVRGPFGNGFDTEKFVGKNLLLIGGGCGFVPLRPLIIDYLARRLKSLKMQIFYGCLNEKTILFKDNFEDWKKNAELAVVLDKPSVKWLGNKGMVTDLIKKSKLAPDTIVVMVGPPIMYKFSVKELLKKGIKEENIYLSLERRMYCGVGVCQHCAIGPYYVCKDGPVFSYSQLKNIPNAL